MAPDSSIAASMAAGAADAAAVEVKAAGIVVAADCVEMVEPELRPV